MGFVPWSVQKLTPMLCKAWGSTALGQHPCREVYNMNEESKGWDQIQEIASTPRSPVTAGRARLLYDLFPLQRT